MRRLIRWLIPTVAAALLPCFLPPLLIAQEAEVAQAYQLSYTSKTTIDFGFGQVKVHEHEGTVTHTLQLRPRQTTLRLDKVRQKYVSDGVFQYDTTMDREKITRVVGGKTEETLVRDLPEEARKRIEQSLGVALCTTDYDESGKEIERTIHGEAVPKMAVVMSQINSTMFFHPPFLTGQDAWDFATEFDTIDPGIARGTMTYKKWGTKGQLVTVKGFGVFTAGKYPLSDQLTETNLKYVVRSEHVYDLSRRAWVSATATVDVSYDLEQNGLIGATATGTMNWKLEALPAR
jgi:hypothetical protein